jgi:adenine-specific DNA methylase
VGDFFTIETTPMFDAVVGNPPYVRYQDFSGEARARGRAAALRAGVGLTGLASSWAAFAVHASLFLKPHGRLGLVLPAELLTVNYAAEVRRFLMERFARVRLVLFTERVFPGVLEEVVLLMAEGEGPTDHCELYQVRDVASLANDGHVTRRWKPSTPEAKWTPSLISSDAFDIYVELSNDDAFSTLQEWGETTLGMVTGSNNYFALSPQRVHELGLRQEDLIPLSPPGSTHLRRLTFSGSGWRELGVSGRPTLLFRPPGEPSAKARTYINRGEAEGVHKAYKCRVRDPWWRVPFVPPADLLLTYMNADAPHLCTNRIRAHHLNSVHGVYLREGSRVIGRNCLPLASLNSMTLLGAETVGRAYGGGILKLEPREGDLLPVPSKDVVETASKALSDVKPAAERAMATGQLDDAISIVDEALLVGVLGMHRSKVQALKAARGELVARRVARGVNPRSDG